MKCDSTSNTQTTIDAGQLIIVRVGIAIAAPMEFLVFELRRSVAGAQVVEAWSMGALWIDPLGVYNSS